MGTIWTLISLWHVTVFSNSLGGRLFIKRDLKASSNAITAFFIFFFPYFLQMLSSFFLFLFLFSPEVCRRLSYLSAYFTQKIKETEREIPGLVLESSLSSSKGTEAIRSEVVSLISDEIWIVPDLVFESRLSSSKGTEAMLSEVKPVFKIMWERDTWLLTNWMIYITCYLAQDL